MKHCQIWYSICTFVQKFAIWRYVKFSREISFKFAILELCTKLTNEIFVFQVERRWARCFGTRTLTGIWPTATTSCWNRWWRQRRRHRQREQRQGSVRGPDTPIVSLVSVIPAPCTRPPFFRADRSVRGSFFKRSIVFLLIHYPRVRLGVFMGQSLRGLISEASLFREIHWEILTLVHERCCLTRSLLWILD